MTERGKQKSRVANDVPDRDGVHREPTTIMDRIPDARDGLTRVERVVLWQLRELESEYVDRSVPTVTLYGRVIEHVDISVHEFQMTLQRMIGLHGPRNTVDR